MPENQNNNDMERCCEYHFNIINKYFENEGHCDESKNIVDELLNEVKTETIVVAMDKYTYKDLVSKYKRKK